MSRYWTISLLATALASGGQRAHAQPLCGEIPDVMIVLDRSGSIKESVDGQTKASIAKSAVQDLMGQFGGQLALGMALFPRWPHANDCSAAAINVSPSTSSGPSIGALLNSNYPKGNTPIAASLETAGVHLQAKSGPRYVILVSDGKETCLSAPAPLAQPGACAWNQGTNYRKCGGCGWQFCLPGGSWSSDCEGNPEMFGCTQGQSCQANGVCAGTAGAMTAAEAAQKLFAWGIKTYVIGFGGQVDAATLSAVASAGGTGQYFQANNLGQLKAALTQIGGAISCCNNGVVDAGELCDTKIAAGLPGACPTSCADSDPCTLDVLDGSACEAHCEHTPITTPKTGDGCCPAGATSSSDSDCPAAALCGNGRVDAGERCDTAIAPGAPGSCALSCDDQNPCTRDVVTGSDCTVACANVPVAPSLVQQDGCCPPGAAQGQDADCLPPCTPDRSEGCIDACVGITCPDGQYCVMGQCQAWPTNAVAQGTPLYDQVNGGCDCRTGGASGPLLPCGLAVLLLALLSRRRRGRC